MLAALLLFTLNVSPEEVNVLGKALGEMPFKEAAPLVRKLDDQLREQQKPAQVPAQEGDKK